MSPDIYRVDLSNRLFAYYCLDAIMLINRIGACENLILLIELTTLTFEVIIDFVRSFSIEVDYKM